VRQRWFGATGIRVPEIAVEGEDVELPDAKHARIGGETYEARVIDSIADVEALQRAHQAGVPVIVRAETAEDVKTALTRPEVSCVAVPPAARELRDLDLTKLTYG
jgi:hypothetical protein